MKLNVPERLVLMNVLPGQGSFVMLSLAAQVRDKLNFSAEERAALKLADAGDGRIQWEPSADRGKEISLGRSEHDLIVGELKKLDEQKKLATHQVDVYRKFVLAEAEHGDGEETA